MFALADYIPVMTNDEIVLLLNGCLPIEQEVIDRWENMLQDRKNRVNNILNKAYAKQ